MSEQWAHFEDASEAKGYALIPNTVMRDGTLSMQSKYLYGLLKSYAWQDSSTYPGISTLSAAAGVSKDTLGKYLKELVEAKLLEVRRRGQGKTNLYVFKKIGPRSDPDGDTGSHQEREEGSDPDGDTGRDNEDSVYEDSVTNSRRGAKAPDPMRNLFGYYCHLADAMSLEITPEDRTQTTGNFTALVRKHELDRESRIRVVSKMLEARTAGVFMSPQKAHEKIVHGNVHQLRPRDEESHRPQKRVL